MGGSGREEIPSPFPYYPVNRECSWKKTQIEKKSVPISHKDQFLDSYHFPCRYVLLKNDDQMVQCFCLPYFIRNYSNKKLYFSIKLQCRHNLNVIKQISSPANWLRAMLLLSTKWNRNESHALLKTLFIILTLLFWKLFFLHILPCCLFSDFCIIFGTRILAFWLLNVKPGSANSLSTSIASDIYLISGGITKFSSSCNDCVSWISLTNRSYIFKQWFV